MRDIDTDQTADHDNELHDFYDSTVRPYLDSIKKLHDAAVSKANRYIRISLIITVALAIWAAYAVHPALGLFPLVFGGAITLIFRLERGAKVAQSATQKIRQMVCDYLGDMTYVDDTTQDSMSKAALISNHVIPKAEKTSTHFMVTGTWRDTPYRLAEMSCTNYYKDSDGDRKSRTIFSGVVLEIHCPVAMPRTLFVHEFGDTLNKLFQWAARNTLPAHRLKSPIAEVEENFEIYSDDVEQAAHHLGADFGLTLMQIAQRHQGGKPYCAAAFEGHNFYLALKLPRNFMPFDVANALKVNDPSTIGPIIDDLMIPRQIIDALIENQH